MTTDKRHREILAEEIRKHYPDGGDWEAETVLAGGDPGYGVAAALVAMSRASEVPGWKLVPVEPTEDMLTEIGEDIELWDRRYESPENAARSAYEIMLASAPTPPHNEGERPEPGDASTRL